MFRSCGVEKLDQEPFGYGCRESVIPAPCLVSSTRVRILGTWNERSVLSANVVREFPSRFKPLIKTSGCHVIAVFFCVFHRECAGRKIDSSLLSDKSYAAAWRELSCCAASSQRTGLLLASA
jgi:hypothetical protein